MLSEEKIEILTYIGTIPRIEMFDNILIIDKFREKEIMSLFGCKTLWETFPELYITYIGEFTQILKDDINVPIRTIFNNEVILYKKIQITSLNENVLLISDEDNIGKPFVNTKMWKKTNIDIINRNYIHEAPLQKTIQRILSPMINDRGDKITEAITEYYSKLDKTHHEY